MKKTEFKLLIREIVREEVNMALKRIMKKKKEVPNRRQLVQKNVPPVVDHKYSNNNVLDNILKETAANTNWQEHEGSEQVVDGMNSILQKSYSGLMNNNNDTEQYSGKEMVESMGVNPDAVPDYITKALSTDYTKTLKNMKDAAEKTRPK